MAHKAASGTPWRLKYEKPQAPRIVDTPAKMARTWGPGKMLIATPRLVDNLVWSIPKGKVATASMLMERLARDHGCNSTCPMTTGIFLRIIAEVAEEERSAGKKRISPYWRVLKSDGSLNSRFPGGIDHQAACLAEEGHRIEPGKGRKAPKVASYQQVLARV
jgi:hypothetical protein